MKQGCKYCAFNEYDGIHLGSNICSVDATHIDPYSEGYCDDFKPKDDGIIRDCGEEKKELAEEVKQGFRKIAENDGKVFIMKRD